MQNSSQKICQKTVNKEEKASANVQTITQPQKKPVQKVVKNPLMIKKNPLMKTDTPNIKQSQQKPVVQAILSEIKPDKKLNESEAKSFIKQQQIYKTKNNLQEKSQALSTQNPVLESKLKDEQKEFKINQTMKQQKSISKQQNNKNTVIVAKNPLMPKQTIQKETKQIVQTKIQVNLLQKKQQQKQIQKIIVEVSKELIPQTEEKFKIESKVLKQQPEKSKDQKKQIKQQSLEIKTQNINDRKQQKVVKEQKKIQIKEQFKNKQSKPENRKVVNPLTAKKNPLIKSQMIFKSSQIKQTVNPLLPKSIEQPKPKQEIIKKQVEDKKKDQKVQTNMQIVDTNNEKKETKIQQEIIEESLQAKQKQTEKIQQQAIARIKLGNDRFSIGMISQSREEQREISNQVEIKITDSFQKGTALSKYMVYQLEGKDKMGPFKISRKYSQFEAIRKIIRQRWPGCFIPSIHSKSQLKNEVMKQKQIRIVLQNFLLGLSYSQHIFYKQQVQLFLRSPEVDIIQMVKQMPVLKAKDVINRYNSCFGEEMFQNVSQSKNSAKIKNFIAKLRKIIASLSSMSIKAQALSEAYDNYAISLSRFVQITKTYEQICLSEYTNNSREMTIILKEQSNKINKLKELPKYNPFNKLYSFINNQTRDAQSFLGIMISSQLFILRREELEAEIKSIQNEIDQISLGHKTLRTMTTRRSKQEVNVQLQAQKKKLYDEKDNFVEIFKITEIILANKEIQFFKSFKRNTYRGVLKEWITLSGQINPQLVELWKIIQDNSRQALKAEIG